MIDVAVLFIILAFAFGVLIGGVVFYKCGKQDLTHKLIKKLKKKDFIYIKHKTHLYTFFLKVVDNSDTKDWIKKEDVIEV